jgi:hypothetical protein
MSIKSTVEQLHELAKDLSPSKLRDLAKWAQAMAIQKLCVPIITLLIALRLVTDPENTQVNTLVITGVNHSEYATTLCHGIPSCRNNSIYIGLDDKYVWFHGNCNLFYNWFANITYSALHEDVVDVTKLHHILSFMGLRPIGEYVADTQPVWKEKGGNILAKALRMIFLRKTFSFEEFLLEFLTRHAKNNKNWTSAETFLFPETGNIQILRLIIWISRLNASNWRYDFSNTIANLGEVWNCAKMFTLEVPQTFEDFARLTHIRHRDLNDHFNTTEMKVQFMKNTLEKQSDTSLTEEDESKIFGEVTEEVKRLEEQRIAEQVRMAEELAEYESELKEAQEKKERDEQERKKVEAEALLKRNTDLMEIVRKILVEFAILRSHKIAVTDVVFSLPGVIETFDMNMFWKTLKKKIHSQFLEKQTGALISQTRAMTINAVEEKDDDILVDVMDELDRITSQFDDDAEKAHSCYNCESHGRDCPGSILIPGHSDLSETREKMTLCLEQHFHRLRNTLCPICKTFAHSAEALQAHLESGTPCDSDTSHKWASVKKHTCSSCGMDGHLESFCETAWLEQPLSRPSYVRTRLVGKEGLRKARENKKKRRFFTDPTCMMPSKRHKQDKGANKIGKNGKPYTQMYTVESVTPSESYPVSIDMWIRSIETGKVWGKIFLNKKNYFVLDNNTCPKKANQGTKWVFCKDPW